MLSTVFKLLKIIQRNFILKNYNKYQTGSIFFHLKIAQYIIMIFMLSRLFSNYLKIIKIKDRRLCEFHIENLQSAKNQTGSIFFHLKIAQYYIIIMYFYVI